MQLCFQKCRESSSIFISLTILLQVKLTCQICDTIIHDSSDEQNVCAIDKMPGAANKTLYLHLTGAQKNQMGKRAAELTPFSISLAFFFYIRMGKKGLVHYP